VSFAGLSGLGVLAAFAAVAGPLVVLYLLKMRRRRIEVPFVKLWQHVLSEREPTSWLQRLRRLLSLLLQLALAALLAFALGDPRMAGRAHDARSVVLVIDCSASMQARDVTPSRMAKARAEARKVVRGLGGADAALILRMDAEPVPVTGWETDGHALERAIESLEASDDAADFDGALALAGDALRGRTGPTIVVVSDGALGEIRRPPAGDVRFVRVGASAGADNVGVTAFNVRRYPLNKSSYEVLLEIVNHSQKPAQRTLTLEADGEAVDVAKLDLAPGEKLRRFYPNLSGAQSRLLARIEPHDALVLDDTAYALLPPRKKQRVLVVTDGNLFLEGGLLLDESAEVDRLTPAAYATARAQGYDVVVFDRFAPAEPPRARGLLYIAPPRAQSPIAVRSEIKRPFLTELAEGHPLLRWITLTDVNIAESSVFALERGDVALASSLHQPIIVAGQRGGQKMLAIGFDLRRSDLPMRVAFPVLLVDALDWFAGDDTQLASSYRTGRPWRVAGPPGASQVTLIDPAGGRALAEVGDDGFALFFGRHVGFHRIAAAAPAGPASGPASGPAADSWIAANLADPNESDITPRALVIAGRTAPPPDLGGPGPRRRLWALLLVAAIALSLFEWVSYQRRWTV